ncbi:GIY-YIG nuclease family protein [Candidatus Microgenomates bacterium]|nr:MAG: GIY-YIG nuclease family protein [Candidatus Microgenomates bacterium]
MYYVYILLSARDGGIYIGKTNSIERRLKEHNLGKVSSTKSRIPLKVVKIFSYKTEQEALEFEKEYKKGFRREQLKRQLGL